MGPASLAGVATGGFIVWVVLAVASLPAVGLTAVASRRHGERRPVAAASAAYSALVLAMGLSLLTAGLGLAGLGPIFSFMETPPEVSSQGAGYLRVYLLGVPIVFAYFVLEAAFRASGDTRTPLRILLLSVTLNFVLDPLLIFGPGPVPALGVEGVASATLLSRAIGCAIGYPLLARRGLIARGRLDRPQMAAILRIGTPLALGGVVFSLIYVVLTRITAPFGTPALAALGVGHRIEAVSYTVSLGFGAAAATAVGQNLGARSADRAEASGRSATLYATYVTLVAAALLLLAPRELIGIFSRDPAVIELGAQYLLIVAASQPFMARELVLEGAMGGAGYTLRPTLASMTLTGLRIPLAYGLAGLVGVIGIWATIGVTAIARGVAMSLFWRAGTWRTTSA